MPAAMIQGAPAYYWEKDYDRITQALMGLNQMLDEREKEKERRKARDMAMLQNDPRMAAGPAGKQFMEQYADDPQAIAFVQSLASQGQQTMDLEAGQSSYFEGLFQAQQEAGRRAAEFMGVGKDLQDAADTMNEADLWIGNQPDPMLSREQMVAQEISDRQGFLQNQEDPRWTAFSGLPSEQRAQMGPWLSQKGQMPMPAILGAGMPALDPKVVLANQMGLPVEDQYQTFMRSIGAAPSIGQEAQLAYNQQSLDARMQMAQDALKAREDLAASQHQARLAEIGARESAISARQDAKGEAKQSGSAGVQAVADDLKDKDKAAREADKKAKAAAPPATVVQRAKVDADKFGWDAGTAAEVFQTVWGKAMEQAGNDPQKAATIFSSLWKKGTAGVGVK